MTGPKDQSAPESAAVNTSILFRLPPELRNRIYRYLVVSIGPVQLQADRFNEPSILATCRAIRTEAITIFLYENKFAAGLTNYDCSIHMKWEKIIAAANLRQEVSSHIPCEYFMQRNPAPHWSNILNWIKLYYGNFTGFGVVSPSEMRELHSAEFGVEFVIIGGMFGMVDQMKSQP